MNSTVGDLSGNFDKVLTFLQKAEEVKADLAIFPEMILTGYPPYDLLDRQDFIEANLKYLNQLCKLKVKVPFLITYVDQDKSLNGKTLLNAVALLESGKIKFKYFKRVLPTYDVFDEARYFKAGEFLGVLNLQGKKLGLSICEDIWTDDPFDPLMDQVKEGVDFLINLSASPYNMGKFEQRVQILKSKVRKYQKALIYMNLVGANDELVFDGRSLVFDSRGQICHELKAFQEDFKLVDISSLKIEKKIKRKNSEDLLDALCLGLKDYMIKSGFSQVVIGLSGGMDSSLVAWIAREVLGPKNVLGVAMPSAYSSSHSLTDAKKLAENLGIEFRVHSIKELYEKFKDDLGLSAGKKLSLALQNLQARIRGNLLMTISNDEGRLLLTTGNKSELAVGYCTLYGDMAGGLAVISDLPKTLVYEVAKAANQRFKAIPKSVFSKAPSAELAPGQSDQDDLPPYDVLDAFLKHYIEEHKDPKAFSHPKLSSKKIKVLVNKIDANEYKRRQAAPGLRVSSKAFGIGRRYPIVNRYRGI